MNTCIKTTCKEPEVKKVKLMDNLQTNIVFNHETYSSTISTSSSTRLLDELNNQKSKDIEKADSLKSKNNIQPHVDVDINSDKINHENHENNLSTLPKLDDVSDILDGIELQRPFPSVTDRYFIPYYKVAIQKPGDDICILIHSNKLCMLTLAPTHNVFCSGRSIKEVNFKVSEKLDRASNRVSGKGKHGAQPLQKHANICSITCSDGEVHVIKCCVIGKLVEVNEALMTNPNLLRKPPHQGGYLAIILLNIKLLEKIKHSLLTKEAYESSVLKCKVQSNGESTKTINSSVNINEEEIIEKCK